MSAGSENRGVTEKPMASLLAGARVVSIGVADFAEALWSQGVPCVHLDWSPHAAEAHDPDIRALLDRLL